MRLVLDTNVLIAAFATEGACMRLYRYCARQHTLVTSEILISEFEEKLNRKLKIAEHDVVAIIEAYRGECQVITPSPLSQPTCRDADDDWVIATAKSGQCVCIVTGDRDLLDLDPIEGLRILQPSSFREFEAGEPGP